jgi:hypothetical protein
LKTFQEFQVSGGHGGRRAGAGRPKGRVSQETADIKAMVVGALCAAGGQDYLQRQAEKNPVAFMGLVGRVLPLQVTGDAGGPIHISFEWAPAQQAVATEADTPPTIDAEPDADQLQISWGNDTE